MAPRFENISDILVHNASKHGDKDALFFKNGHGYCPTSFSILEQKTAQFSGGLLSMGIESGDRVAILSKNRPEWVIADMATAMIGAVSVPIYTTLSRCEITYILNDAEAKAIVIESMDHFEKIMAIISQCSALQYVVSIGALPQPCVRFEALISVGKKMRATAHHHNVSSNPIKAAGRHDLASIVYTSGVTGQPKGVRLTHGNILSNVEDLVQCTPIDETDSVLSFLPLSHVFERTVGYYTILAVGGSIYYAESIEKVSANLIEARPTIFVSVPRLYEKIMASIIQKAKGIRRVILNFSVRIGKKACSHQRPLHGFLRVQHRLADWLVYSKIRQKVGGRLRFFVSGGAPLSVDVATFFASMGLMILEGYGLTESSPVIAYNRYHQRTIGSVGQPLPSMRVKLAEDSELLVKGPNVMQGYWNMSQADDHPIDASGWLHTGDIATIDSQGFIGIIDRKKALIVLSNGKNVAPSSIEQKLTDSPHILSAFVTGDQHSYVTALIVPHYALLVQMAIHKRIPFHGEDDLILNLEIHRMFARIVDNQLCAVSPHEQVKRFTLLSRDFTQEHGELTPTLKLKRNVIRERYKDLIHDMYADPAATSSQVDL